MEKSKNAIIKIAIVGPESTGKSSLAQGLATHYGAPWVPEIARDYLKNRGGAYQLNDIIEIAYLQLKAEEEQIKNAHRFLFCDTTLLVNIIWASFVFKSIPQQLIDHYRSDDYKLHLLCHIDLPWEYDPLREHPQYREELFNLYAENLKQSNANFEVIRGQNNNRLQNAIAAINKFDSEYTF